MSKQPPNKIIEDIKKDGAKLEDCRYRVWFKLADMLEDPIEIDHIMGALNKEFKHTDDYFGTSANFIIFKVFDEWERAFEYALSLKLTQNGKKLKESFIQDRLMISVEFPVYNEQGEIIDRKIDYIHLAAPYNFGHICYYVREDRIQEKFKGEPFNFVKYHREDYIYESPDGEYLAKGNISWNGDPIYSKMKYEDFPTYVTIYEKEDENKEDVFKIKRTTK